VAAEVPAHVEGTDAATFVERELADARPGAATVLFHSIMWQYMPVDDQRRIAAAIEEAGGRATTDAPLAWLRMEPGGEQCEVRLRSWPGGEEWLLATTGYHGLGTRWMGG
jgi:hypothetical protein